MAEKFSFFAQWASFVVLFLFCIIRSVIWLLDRRTTKNRFLFSWAIVCQLPSIENAIFSGSFRSLFGGTTVNFGCGNVKCRMKLPKSSILSVSFKMPAKWQEHAMARHKNKKLFQFEFATRRRWRHRFIQTIKLRALKNVRTPAAQMYQIICEIWKWRVRRR